MEQLCLFNWTTETMPSGDLFYYHWGFVWKIVTPRGKIYYYENNKLHRLDGPAVICPDGYWYWYLYGRHLSEEEFNEAIKPTK